MTEENKDKYKTKIGDAYRYNHGKPRFDLINPLAHRDLVNVLTNGANKYGDRNWENGFAWTSVLASLERHLNAFKACEDYDDETKLLHIAHVAANAHFLNSFYYIFPQGDDRPKYHHKKYNIGLDIDGVIADFIGSWLELYPDINYSDSWYIDREIITKFDTMKDNGELDDFYLNLKPLIDPKEITFDFKCYVTSRPVDSKITEKWLSLNKFPEVPVHTVPLRKSKYEILKEHNIDIFIDDSYTNFVDLNNKGILTYLYDRPHNRKFDVGHLRIKNLSEIPVLKPY